MMKSLQALIGFALFAMASVAHAGFDEGLAAYQRGDYKTAAAEFLPLAEQGSPDVQAYLGVMYAGGTGVPQDYKEAVKWFRLAAEQGYADAQFSLGWLFDQGQGVPQDYKEAVKWYRLAAEQGDAGAQFNLGLMYAKGLGVPQDWKQSYAWSSVAAANSGDAHAVKYRDIAARQLTPEQLAQGQELASQLFAGVIHPVEIHPSETQAQRCIVLATIYTSISDTEPMFGEAMTEFGLFFEEVYYAEYLERTGETMTNGEMNERKEPIFEEFKSSWNKRPESVAHEVAICSAWRSQIAESLINSDIPTENITPKDMADAAGNPPTEVNAEQVKRWLDIGESAFAAWEKYGYITPQKFREAIRTR